MGKRWIAVAAVATLLVAGAMPAGAAQRKPTSGGSTVTASIQVDVYTGDPADTFTDEAVDLYSNKDNVMIVDFTFPAGIVLSDAVIDEGSTCSIGDATLAYTATEVHVTGLDCDQYETLTVLVDGSSTIATAGDYKVTSQYKTQSKRTSLTMWQDVDMDGVVVSEV